MRKRSHQNNDISVVERLVLRRRALGLTQAEIGIRIGRPQARVAELEGGRDVRLSSLVAYANALGCDLIPVPFNKVATVAAVLDPDIDHKSAPALSETGNFYDLFIPDPDPDEMAWIEGRVE
jgi:HTH-type transcriptional regulator/antitoxin HipB